MASGYFSPLSGSYIRLWYRMERAVDLIFNDPPNFKKPSTSKPQRPPHITRNSDLPRLITVDELRQHNARDECWIAVNKNVYDLTDFVTSHPGGSRILLYAAGKDASAIFNSAHGALERAKLRGFLVGELVGCEAPTFPPPDEFHLTVKRRVNEYFTKNRLDRKSSTSGVIHHIAVLSALTILTYLQWHEWICERTPIFCSIAVLYGLAQMQASVTLVHDGSHGSLTHCPALWRIMTWAHDFVNGCSSTVWMYQHVISHHAFTNVDHVDVDIETDEVDLRRFKNHQIWKPFYKLQAFCSPILYMLLAMSLRLRDYSRAFGSPFWGSVLVNRMDWGDLAIFHAGKLFFGMHRIVLPLVFAPCWAPMVLLAFFIADFTVSFSFGLISQASHVSEDVPMIRANEVGGISEDWMRHQIASSVDYAHGSWLTTKFTGGLNFQVAHHLFPNIAQEYQPVIAKIIMDTCEEYGVKYTVKSSLWDAIGGHLGLLHQMGSPPDTHHY